MVGTGANPEYTSSHGLTHRETNTYERAGQAVPDVIRRQRLQRSIALDTEALVSLPVASPMQPQALARGVRPARPVPARLPRISRAASARMLSRSACASDVIIR